MKEIAEKKMKDLNCDTVESAMRMVEGSARSMGIEVPPSMGLTTVFNFQPTGNGRAAINGDYVMTSFKQLMKGGETEIPAITPGDAEDTG